MNNLTSAIPFRKISEKLNPLKLFDDVDTENGDDDDSKMALWMEGNGDDDDSKVALSSEGNGDDDDSKVALSSEGNGDDDDSKVALWSESDTSNDSGQQISDQDKTLQDVGNNNASSTNEGDPNQSNNVSTSPEQPMNAPPPQQPQPQPQQISGPPKDRRRTTRNAPPQQPQQISGPGPGPRVQVQTRVNPPYLQVTSQSQVHSFCGGASPTPEQDAISLYEAFKESNTPDNSPDDVAEMENQEETGDNIEETEYNEMEGNGDDDDSKVALSSEGNGDDDDSKVALSSESDTGGLEATMEVVPNSSNDSGQQISDQDKTLQDAGNNNASSTNEGDPNQSNNVSSSPEQPMNAPPPPQQPQPQPQQISGPPINPRRTTMNAPPQQPQPQPQQKSGPPIDPRRTTMNAPPQQPQQICVDPVSPGLVPRVQVQTRVNPPYLQVTSQSQIHSFCGGASPTPEQDAISLYEAFKGSGCDVGRVVNILAHRDAAHRFRIKEEYRSKYSEELSDRLSSELSGRFKGSVREKMGLNVSLNPTGSLSSKFSCDIKRAVSLWMLDEAERDATIVGQGLTLVSIDLAAVTEVICSRTPSQLRNLKRAYFSLYSSELAKGINSLTSPVMGSHKKLLIACLEDEARDEGNEVDPKMAEDDAKQLYKDGEKIWGTYEMTFIDIFTKRNRQHLVAVDSAYHKLYGHSLEKAVEKEASGYFMDGLLTLLKCAKNPAKYFAEVLKKAMKGMGTSDTTIIRVVVTRAEIDMEHIKKEYAETYKKSLMDAVHLETSGHYRTFLNSLIERGTAMNCA